MGGRSFPGRRGPSPGAAAHAPGRWALALLTRSQRLMAMGWSRHGALRSPGTPSFSLCPSWIPGPEVGCLTQSRNAQHAGIWRRVPEPHCPWVPAKRLEARGRGVGGPVPPEATLLPGASLPGVLMWSLHAHSWCLGPDFLFLLKTSQIGSGPPCAVLKRSVVSDSLPPHEL